MGTSFCLEHSRAIHTLQSTQNTKYFPSLNRGKGIRIGRSTSKGREVFRGTRGGRKNHWWDIDLGPIPKTKK